MATETQIRIRRNPYHGHEVWIHERGELTRRSFDNSIDLAAKLAADCFDDRTIEQAIDMLDRLEWQEPEFPLGVNYIGGYVTVGEACCDYEPSTCAVTYEQESSPLWDLAAASLRIGVVASPWVLLIVAAKWAGVL